MKQSIIPIVEGHGDVRAAPELIRRVLFDINEYEIQVANPKRLKRHRIADDLPKTLQYAAQEPGSGAIIVIVDADRDCAQELAKNISQITQRRNIRLPVAIVCPNTEYEAWLIASVDTIRGRPIGGRGAAIDAGAICPQDVETISDAKKWLSDRMPKHMAYKPTQDQRELTSMMDLQLASTRSRSFRRLRHAVEEIVVGIRSKSARVTP